MTITISTFIFEVRHGGVYVNVPGAFEAFLDYSGRGLSAFDAHWRKSAIKN